MIKMYRQGESFANIGNAVGVSYQIARSRLIEWDIHKPRQHTATYYDGSREPYVYGNEKNLDPFKDEILKLYREEALERRKIARKYDTTFEIVTQHFEKWGQEIYTRNNPRPREPSN